LPVPGNGEFEWSGFIPNDELPHSYNPASGFVASANQRMTPPDFKYAVGFEWADPVRFLRITQVLEDAKARGAKLQVADMQTLQTDVYSLLAKDLQGLLRGIAPAAAPDARAAVQLMLDWDGALRADSANAALFEYWVRDLQAELKTRLVPEAARDAFGELSHVRLAQELLHPSSAAFGADAAAARDALMLDTLTSAHVKLMAERGVDPHQWTWGAIHTMTFRHALDGTPATTALLDRGPMRRSGDGGVVQATSFGAHSYDQTGGASYREIFDLADWDRSVGINVPGQSGQPNAKHYDDLLPLWLEGRYFPLAYSKRAVDAVTTDTLQLTP
jgi:penicillin amidase